MLFPGFSSCSFNKCIEFKINVQSNKEETRSVTNHTTFLPNLKIDHVPQELGFDISKKSLLWLHFSCVCIILNETNRCPSTFFLLHVYRRKLTFSSDVFVVFDKKNDNARATLREYFEQSLGRVHHQRYYWTVSSRKHFHHQHCFLWD